MQTGRRRREPDEEAGVGRGIDKMERRGGRNNG